MCPKVSFVVPVYNVGQFVGQCAQSIFEQTLEDIEVVFVDDATPDDSVSIVNGILEQYPNRLSQVHWVHHKKNKGISEARKSGIAIATGEYLLMVDSDDYVEPNMAEVLYEKAKSSDAEILQYDYFLFSDSFSKEMSSLYSGSDGGSESLRDDAVNRLAPPFVWLRMFKKSLFEHEEYVAPIHSLAEDVVTCTVLMILADKIAYLPLPLYHYRKNPKSITNSKDEQSRMRKYEQYVVNAQVVFDFLERRGLAKKYERGIIRTKMAVRNQLILLTDKKKYRKIWHDTYPELNRMMLRGNDVCPSSYRNKIWYLAVMTGLFPMVRNILFSKHLRPSRELSFPIGRKS